jgi:hypothetical protein
MGEEKRNSKRTPTKVVVNCMISNNWSSVPDRFPSFTKDLSSLGARIVLPTDINAKEQFVLTLEIPTSFIPVLTPCEVVWTRELERQNGNHETVKTTEAGVKFLGIDPRDSGKLKNFLDFKENQL